MSADCEQQSQLDQHQPPIADSKQPDSQSTTTTTTTKTNTTTINSQTQQTDEPIPNTIESEPANNEQDKDIDIDNDIETGTDINNNKMDSPSLDPKLTLDNAAPDSNSNSKPTPPTTATTSTSTNTDDLPQPPQLQPTEMTTATSISTANEENLEMEQKLSQLLINFAQNEPLFDNDLLYPTPTESEITHFMKEEDFRTAALASGRVRSSTIDTISTIKPHTQKLKTATIEAIVTHLTSPEVIDYQFLVDFFLTFRNYIDALPLMELILCRLTWSLKKASQQDKSEAKVGCLALVRTFVSLRHWILNHFQDDFVDNVQIRQLFTHTLNEVSHHSVFTNAKTSLQTKVIVDLKKSYLKLCHIFWSSIKLPTDPHTDYLEYQIPALETIQSSRLSTLGLKQLRNPSVRRQSVLSLMGKRSSNGTNKLLQEYDDMVKKEGKSLEKILKARSARHENPKVGNSFEANDKFILYPKASMYSLRQTAQLALGKSDTMENIYSEILQGVKYTPVPGVKHLDAPGRNMDIDAGFIIKGQVEVFTSAKIKKLATDAPLKKLSDGPVLGDDGKEKKVVVKEEKRKSVVNALSPGKRKKSMARLSAPASPKKQKKKFLKMFKGKDKHSNTNTTTSAAEPNSNSKTVSSPNPNTTSKPKPTTKAQSQSQPKETKAKHSTLNLKDLEPIVLYNTNTTTQSTPSKSNTPNDHEQYDLLSSRILSDFQALTGIYNLNGSTTGSTTGHKNGPISRSTTNRSLQDYLDVKSRAGSIFNFDKLMAGVSAMDSPTKHRGGVFGPSPSKSKFGGSKNAGDVNGAADVSKGPLTKLDPGSNVTLDHDAVLAAASGDADVSGVSGADADVSGVSTGDILAGYGHGEDGAPGDILGDVDGDNDSFDMLSGGEVASFKSPSVTMNWSNSLDLNGSAASIIDLNGNSTKEELAPGVVGGNDVEKKDVDSAVDAKKNENDDVIEQADIENISVMKDESKIQELKDDDENEEDGVILPNDDKTEFHMVHQTPTTTPQLQQQSQLNIPKTRAVARSVPASESTAVDSPNLGGFGSNGIVGGPGNGNNTQLSQGLSDRFSVRVISRNSIMSAKSYITYDSELSLNEDSRGGYGGYGRYNAQDDDDDGYKLKKKSSVVDLRVTPTDEHSVVKQNNR
ncbi:unnamed protein product [Ambrosiozyma monospora]|uniref:Unnamed protein product n=1 Tax=Ambrosiozyma monospora TaxID=43982 RepID=A0ACB5SZB7_AMBMO|nr:unnamed protein product [Ambrosiozyma monospora]